MPSEKSTALSNVQAVSLGGLRFAPVAPPVVMQEKAKRVPKPKQKHDPRLVAAARELRDRWLEQVNASPLVAVAKYDVSRGIEENTGGEYLGSRESCHVCLKRLDTDDS